MTLRLSHPAGMLAAACFTLIVGVQAAQARPYGVPCDGHYCTMTTPAFEPQASAYFCAPITVGGYVMPKDDGSAGYTRLDINRATVTWRIQKHTASGWHTVTALTHHKDRAFSYRKNPGRPL